MTYEQGKKKLWVVCGLSVLLVIGTTLAVWHQHIQHTNHLEADTIKAQVVENFTPSEPKDTVTKDVSFKNEGTTDVFVRVAYVETWEKRTKQRNHAVKQSVKWKGCGYKELDRLLFC